MVSSCTPPAEDWISSASPRANAREARKDSPQKDLLRHLEELEERGGRLTWLKALSDTANGALTGQELFPGQCLLALPHLLQVHVLPVLEHSLISTRA